MSASGSGGNDHREGGAASDAGVDGSSRHDFDLHGLVGIRLVDAGPIEIATVRRQLGPLDSPLDREPDITIRFVDRVTASPVTYVGLGVTGYNGDGFFVSRATGAAAPRARIPFDQVGNGPEILCERGLPLVPHLLAIINLTALTKGVLPLHASAFTMDDTGVLVTGWAKAGKTEALLACMQQGAEYVGDEWVYLTDSGDMYGLPEPIRLWSWHLRQVPAILRARPRRDRLRLSVWHRAAEAAKRAARVPMPGADVVRKGAPTIARQAYLQIAPQELFGKAAVTLHGNLDAVVLVMNSESPGMVVEPITGHEVARRMAASLADERAPLMEHYAHFRYAFPAASSDVIEKAADTESRLLSQLLDGRAATRVTHPYPCDIAALGRAVLAGVAQQRHDQSGDALSSASVTVSAS
jgi:hypothetical protein